MLRFVEDYWPIIVILLSFAILIALEWITSGSSNVTCVYNPALKMPVCSP